MKKVFEYQGVGDPLFFSTLRKAYDMVKYDIGEDEYIESYRTVQQHIKEKGYWEREVEWISDYISIVKREVL